MALKTLHRKLYLNEIQGLCQTDKVAVRILQGSYLVF
jgi:hypothetical protein